ncbi:MAG: HAD-like domain-containing protein [Piptocephalis tieghemiana]|nr:MAG: HAD-like domain-containing protein [Piptocephalis tieghemiana]
MPTTTPVFFFDIDNCLYEDSATDMFKLMRERIYSYAHKAGIHDDRQEVERLCQRYYLDYGLAVRGLLQHHDIDPVDYDKKVDGTLPLEEVLKEDPALRDMLLRCRIRRWAFTNAGLNHAQRVLKILGVADLFEGITYCDYSVPDFPCKPEERAYAKAIREAGITKETPCYLVDDSPKNIDAAKALGWTAVHVNSTRDSMNDPRTHGHYQISKVTDLPNVLPDLWELQGGSTPSSSD